MLASEANVIAAEEQIVATCLTYPDRIVEVGFLPADRFLDPRCRKAWAAMLSLHAEAKTIDPFTVAEACPPLVATDLTQWIAQLSISYDLPRLATAVTDASITREVTLTLGRVEAQRKREDLRGREYFQLLHEELAKIHVVSAHEPQTMATMLMDRFRDISVKLEARERGEKVNTGIPTGLPHLDAVLSGLKRKRVTLIAARPSMGKSSLSRQIADHATQEGHATHVFAMEDSDEMQADRSLSAWSGLPADKIETLDLSRSDIGQLMTGIDRFGKRPNWLVDMQSGLPAEEIIRLVRAWRPKLGTELVIVDYVGLMKRQRRETQKDMLDRSMKLFLACARDDDLAILLLSQLNRDCEGRPDKRPTLRDLKDSGSLEEEAKTILFLYRDHVYDKNADPSEAEIIVAKNANGRTGTAPARWDGPTMVFS